MKVAIIGSRGFEDYSYLSDCLNQYKDQITHVISGGAKGADKLAELWADTNNIPKIIFLPDYKNFPAKIAPIKRNKQIVKECDFLIAFWDGQSKGTASAINFCKELNKPYKIIVYNKADFTII